MSIECPRPIEFRNNLSEHEKDIMSKGTPEYLHKFVKISSFLDDLWNHLITARQEIRDEFDPKRLSIKYQNKKRSENSVSFREMSINLERRAAGKDYSADGLVQSIKDVMEKAVEVFPKEFDQGNIS